jgi:hypothetical protein
MNSLYLVIIGLVVVVSASAFYFSGKPSIANKSAKPSKSSETSSPEIAQAVSTAIKDNDVMIFSKSYCPYCNNAKKALSDLNINFVSWELDVSGYFVVVFVVCSLHSFRIEPMDNQFNLSWPTRLGNVLYQTFSLKASTLVDVMLLWQLLRAENYRTY